MTWIKTILCEVADTTKLRSAYDAIYSLNPSEYPTPVSAVMRPDGATDSITAAHCLIPESLRFMMSGLGSMLQAHLPLTVRQQEMIPSVVSAQNQCFY